METKYFENVNGHIIKLEIQTYTNVLQVTVINKNKSINLFGTFLLVLINVILITFRNTFSISTLMLLDAWSVYALITCVQKGNELIQLATRKWHFLAETLLFVRDLGCQVKSESYVGYSSKFIPVNVIDGIFINEIISKVRLLSSHHSCYEKVYVAATNLTGAKRDYENQGEFATDTYIQCNTQKYDAKTLVNHLIFRV